MRFCIGERIDGDKTSAKITKTYHNQMNSFHYPAMSMFASYCKMTQNYVGSHKQKKNGGGRKRIWFFHLVEIHVGLYFLLFLFLFLFIHYMCSSVVSAKLKPRSYQTIGVKVKMKKNEKKPELKKHQESFSRKLKIKS